MISIVEGDLLSTFGPNLHQSPLLDTPRTDHPCAPIKLCEYHYVTSEIRGRLIPNEGSRRIYRRIKAYLLAFLSFCGEEENVVRF